MTDVEAFSSEVHKPEPSATLLVHFGPGCDSIHSHEEHLPGLDDAKEHFEVVEDVGKDLLLSDTEVYVLVVGVRALVDDPVHVQVQIIKLWDL